MQWSQHDDEKQKRKQIKGGSMKKTRHKMQKKCKKNHKVCPQTPKKCLKETQTSDVTPRTHPVPPNGASPQCRNERSLLDTKETLAGTPGHPNPVPWGSQYQKKCLGMPGISFRHSSPAKWCQRYWKQGQAKCRVKQHQNQIKRIFAVVLQLYCCFDTHTHTWGHFVVVLSVF